MMALGSAKIVLALCFIAVAVNQAACDNVQIKNLDIENKPNDYFGDIVADVKPQGDESSITVAVPVKKDLDESFKVKLSLSFNGLPILNDHEFPLCDALNDDGFFKPLIKNIEPMGTFPEKCPIPAGDWKVVDYVVNPADFLPFGLVPSGDFEMKFDIIQADAAEPLIKVAVTGTVASTSSFGSLSSVFKLI